MGSSAVFWLSLVLCCSTTFSLPLPEEHDSEESRKVLGSSVVTSVSVVMENDNDTETAYFTDAAGRPVERPKEGDEIGSPVDLITPDRYQFYTFDASGNLIKRYMTQEEVKSIIANGQKTGQAQKDSPTFYHNVPAEAEDLAVEPTEEGNHEHLSSQMKVHRVVESVQNVLKSQLASAHEEMQLADAPMTPDTSASWSMILPSYLGNAADENDSSTLEPFIPTHEVVDDKMSHSGATSSESLPLGDAPTDSMESGSGDKTEETLIDEETTDKGPEIELPIVSLPVVADLTEHATETATLIENSEPESAEEVEEVVEEGKEDEEKDEETEETTTLKVELLEKTEIPDESISEIVNGSVIPAVVSADKATAETDDEAEIPHSHESSSSTTAKTTTTSEATTTEHVTSTTSAEKLVATDSASAGSSKPAAESSGSAEASSESQPMPADAPESPSFTEESDEVSPTEEDSSVKENQTKIPETLLQDAKENSTVTGLPDDVEIFDSLQDDEPIDLNDSEEPNLNKERESLESVANKDLSASVAHSADISTNNLVDTTSTSSSEIRLPSNKLPPKEAVKDSPEEVSPTVAPHEHGANEAVPEVTLPDSSTESLTEEHTMKEEKSSEEETTEIAEATDPPPTESEEDLEQSTDGSHESNTEGNIPISFAASIENLSNSSLKDLNVTQDLSETLSQVLGRVTAEVLGSIKDDELFDMDETTVQDVANKSDVVVKSSVSSSHSSHSTSTSVSSSKNGLPNKSSSSDTSGETPEETSGDGENSEEGASNIAVVDSNKPSQNIKDTQEEIKLAVLTTSQAASSVNKLGQNHENKFEEGKIPLVEILALTESDDKMNDKRHNKPEDLSAANVDYNQVVPLIHPGDSQGDSSSHEVTMAIEETVLPVLNEDASIPISSEVANSQEKKNTITIVKEPEGSGNDADESSGDLEGGSGDFEEGSGDGSSEEPEVITPGHNIGHLVDFTTAIYDSEKDLNDGTKSDSPSEESSPLPGAMDLVPYDVMNYTNSDKDFGVTASLLESATESDSSSSDITDVFKYIEGNKNFGLTTPSNKDSEEQNDGNLSNVSKEKESSNADYDGSKSTEYDVNKYVNGNKDIGLTTPSPQDVSAPDNKDTTTTEQSDENSSIFDVTKYANSDKDIGVTTHKDLKELNDEQQDASLSAENILDVNNYIISIKDLEVTTQVDAVESNTGTEEQDVSQSDIYDVNKYVNSDTDLGVTTPMSEVESETEIPAASSSSEDVELNNSLNSESTTDEIEPSTDSPEEILQESTTLTDVEQEMNDEPLEVEDESDASENDDESHQQYFKTPLTGLKNPEKKPTIPEPEKSWTKVDVISPHGNIQEESQATTQSDESLDTSTKSQSSSQSPNSGLVDLKPAPEESMGLEASTAHLFEDVQKFADLCNELAFKMWLSATGKGVSAARSIVMSPFAITSLLSMIFLGAKGPTSGQMNDILKLDDMMTFNPHQVFRNVTESVVLEKNPGVSTAAFVRQLYSDKDKGKMLDFYKQRANEFYDGHIEEVNFATIGDTVRRRTNMLVKKQTAGKISEYMRGSNLELQPPLAAFSANIFQTDCSSASSEGRDGEMYFTVLPASRQRRLVPIPAVVYRSGFMAGYEPGLDATVVSLEGHDSAISTILVLPGQQGQLAPGDGLPLLEDRLFKSLYTEGAWSKLLRSLLSRTGLEVQIPRFSHRSQLNMTQSLQTMGLNDLFDPLNADLKGLSGSSNDLHVSDVVQVNTFSTCGEDVVSSKHHVEIYPGTPQRSGREGVGSNEAENLENVPLALRPRQARIDMSQEPNGFEDLLVEESVYKMPLALRPRQAREPEEDKNQARLKFDRPFLYLVRHNPTGFILHMGRFNPRLLN